MVAHSSILLALGAALACVSPPLPAQIIVKNAHASLTVEAYNNSVYTTGAANERTDNADWQVDAAIRALTLVGIPGLGRIGGRIVGQGLGGAQDDLRIGERSVIWTGSSGRLEYGNRMGLPDVLTGYAPNAFQFTSAEFGPASGLSLDPGGGITSLFIADIVRASVDSLSALGAGASLFGDQSRKILYVSPKRGGFLGGVSFAADVNGSAATNLIQSGLVHETYWGENELRLGGGYTHVEPPNGGGVDSLYAGATLILNNEWTFGIAATWNPDAPQTAIPGWYGDAVGITSSLNYNRGPWTFGGFLQDSRGRETASAATQWLRAGELGASYRISTKLRLFTAVYHYRFDPNDGDSGTNKTQLIAGFRVAL